MLSSICEALASIPSNHSNQPKEKSRRWCPEAGGKRVDGDRDDADQREWSFSQPGAGSWSDLLQSLVTTVDNNELCSSQLLK